MSDSPGGELDLLRASLDEAHAERQVLVGQVADLSSAVEDLSRKVRALPSPEGEGGVTLSIRYDGAMVKELGRGHGYNGILIAKVAISAIDSAVEYFQLDNSGRLPESLEALWGKDEFGTSYIMQSVVPVDPWGNEYIFEPDGAGGSGYLIWTYGADGSQGGEGENMDFNNQMIRNGEV